MLNFWARIRKARYQFRRSCVRWLLHRFGEQTAEEKLKSSYRRGKEKGRTLSPWCATCHYRLASVAAVSVPSQTHTDALQLPDAPKDARIASQIRTQKLPRLHKPGWTPVPPEWIQ